MQLYIFGGHDENGNYLADGQVWSVQVNSTSNPAQMPTARSGYGAGAINNATIYIVGGYSSQANETNNVPEACNLVYNVTGDTWSTGACLQQSRGATCAYDLFSNTSLSTFAVQSVTKHRSDLLSNHLDDKGSSPSAYK